jgi:hypothetical protein
MATDGRGEYEAWWHLEKLRQMMGGNTLQCIIAESLSLTDDP